MPNSICELVRRNETAFISGTTQTSKYVNYSMSETINRIEAYLNSKHLEGQTDSLGRDRPFFNISVGHANIWMRATDIDRNKIRVRATKSKDWLDSFLATVHLQDWMRRENFSGYLNQWGRILARFGSAITKFVEKNGRLQMIVMSWTRMIIDSVDFAANPKIEIIELTEGQLYERIVTHGYNADQVTALMGAITTRETLQKQRKDNKTGYIRLYEVHGVLSQEILKKGKGEVVLEGDDLKFTQQVAVVSFVNKKVGRAKADYADFTLYAGAELEDPYRIDHLIKEDDRSLAVGSVERLFDVQWMQNHAVKTEKDTLDLASRLIFQTPDPNFLNMNVLDNIESGDILIHKPNMPLTQVNTGKYDITSMMNFRASWKQLGQEINGISDAMLGMMPRTRSAAMTSMILQENYSLFEHMTQNKGIALTEMMRERILPFIKTKMDTTAEVAATLEAHEITRLDSVFLKTEAIKRTNRHIMDAINTNLDNIAQGKDVQPIDASGMFNQNMQDLQSSMATLGNSRYFKPSEMSDATWQEQFKDLEWDVEVDVTGENEDIKGALAALASIMQIVMDPGFATNKKAQAIVGRTLELTGTMSPIEYNALPDSPPAPAAPAATPTLTPSSSTDGVLPGTAQKMY